ncbi:MAG: 3-oxoacyl-[acyl-carrier-protein] reductase [Actinobacteria bacterium]|nr:3-oxoacyl-[acyl-carrier-protein] reductase [Actinomycetota bacterium]
MIDLNSKIALVTGASRGIGAAIATTLARQGASVAVNYFGSEQAARAVVEEITREGGKAVAIQANVGVAAEADRLLAQVIETFGRVDIVVNNAGITRDGLLVRMSDSDWRDVIDTNLTGTFNVTRAVTRPMMKQRAGTIINITSVVGLTGNAGQANYSAAKAGVIGLTKSTARELASRGIRVNAVAPGFIETDMTAELSESVRSEVVKDIALGTLGKPADVANMVAFLASEEARYITGQVIAVDGGMTFL